MCVTRFSGPVMMSRGSSPPDMDQFPPESEPVLGQKSLLGSKSSLLEPKNRSAGTLPISVTEKMPNQVKSNRTAELSQSTTVHSHKRCPREKNWTIMSPQIVRGSGLDICLTWVSSPAPFQSNTFSLISFSLHEGFALSFCCCSVTKPSPV